MGQTPGPRDPIWTQGSPCDALCRERGGQDPLVGRDCRRRLDSGQQVRDRSRFRDSWWGGCVEGDMQHTVSSRKVYHT